MAQFQLRLFRHYNNGGAPLYDPNEMEAFEPALFTQIINSINYVCEQVKALEVNLPCTAHLHNIYRSS